MIKTNSYSSVKSKLILTNKIVVAYLQISTVMSLLNHPCSAQGLQICVRFTNIDQHDFKQTKFVVVMPRWKTIQKLHNQLGCGGRGNNKIQPKENHSYIVQGATLHPSFLSTQQIPSCFHSISPYKCGYQDVFIFTDMFVKFDLLLSLSISGCALRFILSLNLKC